MESIYQAYSKHIPSRILPRTKRVALREQFAPRPVAGKDERPSHRGSALLPDQGRFIESPERPLEETFDRIRRAVVEYGVRALKTKVCCLMFMTKDIYAKGLAGKTDRLIPMLREHYGPGMALYADANG